MHKKIVYVLGAGASASAHLPTQAGLLTTVFSIYSSSFDLETQNDDFLSLSVNGKLQRVQEFYPRFDEYRQELGRFIITTFSSTSKFSQYNYAIVAAQNICENDKDSLCKKETLLSQAYDVVKSINVSLEDLFTIFDSVISGREHFKMYSENQMAELHRKLRLCIIYALSFCIAKNCDNSDYKEFAKHLLLYRNRISLKDDSLAVITMNWDDLLETELYSICTVHNQSLTPNQIKTFPDLCFYNYSLSDNSGHIPSTQLKAKGFKNIKVLKMHGSLAWLECPRCGCIFTDDSDEIASEEFSAMKCPRCSNGTKHIEDSPTLRSLIITPTFLKSFDNLSIKNIWHNAFIDISEATEIVFIGYSFPDADFEMRCMLKKACNSDVNITVVLSKYDDPKTYIDELVGKGIDEEDASRIVSKMRMPEERYKSFFGSERVRVEYCGFSEYIRKIGDTHE